MTMPEMTPEMRAAMEETSAMLARGEMMPAPMPLWWEPRRPGEMTPEYLGRVLDELPSPELAERARLGHFDDFHAPADIADGLELLRLAGELRVLARETPALAERIAVIENALRRGEFDATLAESDRWAASKEGQETLGELVGSAARAARRPGPKLGRNDPCWCGSGVKYKRCHGA